jgi:uncharacterized protein (TIGR01777 family)
MMEILLTGGTGLIGRALCAPLLAAGHRLTVLSRRPDQVEALCGEGVQALARLADWEPERHFDAVINLAGAPIVDRPWTTARRRVLWESRVTLTEELVAAIGRAHTKPVVLLSGSAIGFYGDQGEAVCSDAQVESPLGHGMDFGGRLCAAWEAAARHAEGFGVRVCLLRTGLVLARQGGFYARLHLPFSLGLGTRLGHGRQWMSWIHIEDYVGAVLALLRDDALRGAYNLTAPQPARNAEFTAALATSLHRPAFFVAPACLIRLGLGQRAYFLLGGQKVLPQRLEAAGFAFRHAVLAEALAALAR